MTTFFLAGLESGDTQAEVLYDDLREQSRIAVGCPAKLRRIFKLNCRLDGRDCEIEVGRPLSASCASDVVVAILDHGREEPYLVHTDGAATPVRVGRPVYAVTEFA
ncbi:MAG TPA: hypothetical protein VID48_07585 [Solirubrobacteraceae bacterium]